MSQPCRPQYFIAVDLVDVSHNLDESLAIIEAMSGLIMSSIESSFDKLSESVGHDQAENLYNGMKTIAGQARIAHSLVDSAIAGKELKN